ncbi:DUF853 family protein [Halovulum dunhuangense]|uniref:DUF853 family protein n=1 Tax=Halovulum dunhuangense TaxID=1505036 RepID=A0A849L2U3_9RHOB|nr:helicase HerA-like domain-containing protein [Halovulum dunhuangense]NNU80554.1 DUF853 family protein [Halovulum dunhuangense]
MTDDTSIFLGGGGESQAEPCTLALKYANRHGLVAGATGTGKTVTLQIMAESFAARGVPVFLADVKGDLAGLSQPGAPTDKAHQALQDRAARIGFADYGYDAFPVVFWDMFGEQGHPVRTTISEMGPLLLSRLLELTEAQEGVLNIAFRLADEHAMPLIDLKDLRAFLVWLGENSAQVALQYGNVSTASVGAIQRRLLVLENQGAAGFFGEPALELHDMIRTGPDGRGQVNVLAADRLMSSPRLYATFLLWLLSELFEELPEVGDPEKPKFVFFFDEAHLLFDGAPKALVDKVEQVARLIRSKGVGVYFVTQNPDDVPPQILSQLGNRVQHALRAFTPRDQKALKAAAETFRPNPRFDTAEAIRDVGVGEGLVSTLQAKGAPGIVERVLIRPPSSRMGPIGAEERRAVIAASPLRGIYDRAIEGESAYEMLQAKAEKAAAEAEAAEQDKAREFNAARRYSPQDRGRATSRTRADDSIGELLIKSAIKTASTRSGRTFIRGVLGGLFRGR